MVTIGWYLLKVTICAAILYGYYHVALRNKIFHHWNRFYLLASVLLSMMLPVIQINIFQPSIGDSGGVIKMLRTINTGDDIVIQYTHHSGWQLTAENIIIALYALIAITLLALFSAILYKIFMLKKSYPSMRIQDILFVATDARGTPFSFFKSIFWNNAIDLESPQGQQIFKHEIAHIREKHSYDKIFMNVVLILFWINPFFWLIRHELGMIHEFIADRNAVENSDSSAFAAMLLRTIYPSEQLSLTSNFFHSPLKRRLTMFTKNNNPKVSYISRLAVLPLIAIIFFAFTVKMKTVHSVSHSLGKKITVVIDAGHGGSDNGAVEDNVLEKDINLAIAKDIKELNKDANLNIILSRTGDDYMNPRERVTWAEKNNADLFISIHANVDAEKSSKRGIEVYVAKYDNPYLVKSKLFGSSIINALQNTSGINVSNALLQPNKGVWVLNAAPCPAVLVETGYMDNNDDLKFITNRENQKTIAQNILNGIEFYAEQNMTINYKGIPVDTPPTSKTRALPDSALYIIDGKVSSAQETKNIDPEEIKEITILSGNDAMEKYGDKGKNGVIIITTKQKVITRKGGEQTIKPEPQYIINGKESSEDASKNISSQPIESVNVLKKESSSVQQDTLPDKVFIKVEHDAQFPGGQQAWLKYIVSKIQDSASEFTQKDYGTCYVRFIVNTDGAVTNVEPKSMKDTHLASIAVNAIKNGPKWIPATQNGHTVASYRIQPVTVTEPSK